MAYKVLVTQAAEQDIEEIIAYFIEKLDSKAAATNFIETLSEKYDMLARHPGMFELSHREILAKQGYRKIIINNFVLLYRIDDTTNEVFIVRLFYGKRDYEKLI